MYEALSKAGVLASFIRIEGAGHPGLMAPISHVPLPKW